MDARAVATLDDPKAIGLDLGILLPAPQVDVVDRAGANLGDTTDEPCDVVFGALTRPRLGDLIEVGQQVVAAELNRADRAHRCAQFPGMQPTLQLSNRVA